jgi:hypothetical protein
MDFNFGIGIPEEWEALREEAKPLFKSLPIFVAHLERVQPEESLLWNS